MSKLKINIKGKRIETFLSRLIKADIELINIEYISYQEINVMIYKDDYVKLKKIKTSYKFRVIKKYGLLNIKDKVMKSKILIFFMFIGIILLSILSNIIFSIEVIHTNKEIRELLYQELYLHDLRVHHFKKSKDELEKIKVDILKEHKDKIEWLEIEEKGTAYIIRVEERIIPKIEFDITPRHVIAKKNAVIKRIDAKAGNVIRLRGEYVSKGDVIISGNIMLNDSIKDMVHALGDVYGEVWYTTSVSYPYAYQEEIYTGNITNNLIFKFLNNDIYLLGTKYKYQKNLSKKVIASTYLPIMLSYEENREIKKIDYILTCDQASNKAIEKGKEKIEKNLDNEEYIIKTKVLESSCLVDRVKLKIFYAVLENITDYQIIN